MRFIYNYLIIPTLFVIEPSFPLLHILKHTLFQSSNLSNYTKANYRLIQKLSW